MCPNRLISGIVCEYNPFHNGHFYHLSRTRAAGATHIVCVMSGNFTQRGEPAILDKWARARCALLCGADLVLELPLPWAMAGAEAFARGAVGILDALGCVEALSFGCETPDSSLLATAAGALLDPALSPLLREELRKGDGFAAARERAVLRLAGEQTAKTLQSPNNILAVEYVKAAQALGASLRMLPIARRGAGHDAPEAAGGFCSASALRSLLLGGGDALRLMPPASRAVWRQAAEAGHAPVTMAKLEQPVLSSLRALSLAQAALLPDLSEGLENRLYEAVYKAVSLEELYTRIKAKRYSHARVRRLVLSAFLGLRAGDNAGIPPYLRVLGFNSRGREILQLAKQNARLPIVTRAGDFSALGGRAGALFALECRSTDQFALASPAPRACGLEYTQGIIRV